MGSGASGIATHLAPDLIARSGARRVRLVLWALPFQAYATRTPRTLCPCGLERFDRPSARRALRGGLPWGPLPGGSLLRCARRGELLDLALELRDAGLERVDPPYPLLDLVEPLPQRLRHPEQAVGAGGVREFLDCLLASVGEHREEIARLSSHVSASLAFCPFLPPAPRTSPGSSHVG